MGNFEEMIKLKCDRIAELQADLAAAKKREERLWELLDEAISGWDKVLGGHGIRNEYAAFLQKRRAVRTELEGE